MIPNKFRESILAGFTKLVDVELSSWDRLVSPKNLLTNLEFQSVALDRNARYEDVYKKGLETRHYNFILCDFSYFQFSIAGNPRDPDLRYAYYANPFQHPSFDFEELIEEGGNSSAISELYSQSLDEAEIVLSRPPIRYDYQRQAYKELSHPAGHLHVGAFQASRWPVRRIITPEAFTLFVAKHYYPEFWLKGAVAAATADGFDNRLDQGLADAYKECAQLTAELFSRRQAMQPHIA